MKTRLILTVLSLCAALALCTNASAQTCRIHGRIFFPDSLKSPANNVTVYIPENGKGTITDDDGNFRLDTGTGSKGKKLTVEISHIGYESIVRQVNPGTTTDIDLGEVVLQEQLIMLPSAYITPNHKSAANYILGEVRKRAVENRKKHPDYDATISYSAQTHHIPLVSQVLPGIAEGAVKTAASMLGIGNCIRYAMDTDDLSGDVTFERSVRGGSTRDYNARIIRSSTKLPAKVEKELKSVFKNIDLFNFLYSDDCIWGINYNYRYKFVHTGTYMWNGKLVDILQWKGKRGFLWASVHVVQDDWGILKVEAGYQDKKVLCEARDRGDGVYMPVSLVITPNFFPVIEGSKTARHIEMIKSEKRLGDKTKKKIITFLEENSNIDIHPYIIGRVSVQYH
ncbi:MAG: carboxypeptidase-like regulatory domain-containing protein [Bacteroidales bacterium]|nr:carboxypeptidase-like regulatory domain-containing protein [Bacteroidales bacterium]